MTLLPLLQIILVLATALGICLVSVPLIIRYAPHHGGIDLPDALGRKVHTTPISRLGGIAIFLSFFVTYIFWSRGPALTGILAGSMLIFFVGLLDDFKSLPAKFRLATQLVCCSGAVAFTGLAPKALALTPSFVVSLPPVLGFLIAVFVIVGAINSINMIDGLDGLAGGVVVIGIAMLSFIHLQRTDSLWLALTIGFPIIGAILGFLRYNTHPAKVFMGDGGSNWLGYMTGVYILLVLGDYQIVGSLAGATGSATDIALKSLASPKVSMQSTAVPLLSVMMCFSLPILDTLYVMISRWRNGVNPMQPDKRHFHHTLLRVGLSHSQSVTAVYFLALLGGVLGVVPIAFPKFNLWWVPYVGLAFLTVTVPLGAASDGRILEKILTSRAVASRDPKVGSKLRHFLRMWEAVNRYGVYFLLFVSPAFAGVAPEPIGQAAAVGAAVVFISMFVRSGKGDFLDSLILSMGAGILFIANNQNTMMVEMLGTRYSIQTFYNGIFIGLFTSAALFVLVTVRKKYFITTPSDFLLVTLPMVLLLVPEPYQSRYLLNTIALRCLILFLVMRCLVRTKKLVIHRIKLVTCFGLLYIAMTSLMNLRIVYH